MKSITTKHDSSQPVADTAVYLFDDWFDPIEAGVRDRVRGFIQAMIEGELDETLMRPRYGRRSASSSDKNEAAVAGHRHGHNSRSLTGTFGRTEIAAPRARLLGADGQKVLLAIKSMGGESTEAWRSVLDDLIERGLRRPQLLIVDGAPGLEKA